MHAAERGELEAFRDFYAAAPPQAGARAEDVGGALCLRLDSVPEVTMFNRVLGLGIGEPASEAGVDAALAFLEGVVAYVPVAPEAEPPQLARWLEARGLRTDYGWTKFSRTTQDAPDAATELRVERDEDGTAFAEAATRGFGVPDFFRDWLAALASRDGWQLFAAFAGDEPAGGGALYVDGEVGWIGIGATAPEHRGRGAQGALLAARIAAAAEAGCTVVVTETGEPAGGRPNGSYRNIVRAGFEPLYVRPNYLSIAASYAAT